MNKSLAVISLLWAKNSGHPCCVLLFSFLKATDSVAEPSLLAVFSLQKTAKTAAAPPVSRWMGAAAAALWVWS
ncbi:MAG: hypothetical protein WCB44_05715 [Stellaceae bacterium]